jgi:hypothetical protein
VKVSLRILIQFLRCPARPGAMLDRVGLLSCVVQPFGLPQRWFDKVRT